MAEHTRSHQSGVLGRVNVYNLTLQVDRLFSWPQILVTQVAKKNLSKAPRFTQEYITTYVIIFLSPNNI